MSRRTHCSSGGRSSALEAGDPQNTCWWLGREESGLLMWGWFRCRSGVSDGCGKQSAADWIGSCRGNTHTHTHTHTLLPHPPPGTLWVKCYTGVRYFCVWTSLLSLVGSQPSYLTFLNLIDLIWKSSWWRSNEREIPPPRPCCEHSAHPRPLCMDLRCHCRGGNRVQGKYKEGWWVREQQRETQRKSYGCRTQLSCQSHVTGKTFYWQKRLPWERVCSLLAGKAGGHLRGALKWIPALVKILLSWHPTVRQILGSLIF